MYVQWHVRWLSSIVCAMVRAMALPSGQLPCDGSLTARMVKDSRRQRGQLRLPSLNSYQGGEVAEASFDCSHCISSCHKSDFRANKLNFDCDYCIRSGQLAESAHGTAKVDQYFNSMQIVFPPTDPKWPCQPVRVVDNVPILVCKPRFFCL